MNIDIKLPPAQKISKILIICILILALLSIIGQVFKYYLNHGWMFGFVPLFYLDLESNIPAWFSSFILFLASLLLFLITVAKYKKNDSYRHHWKILAILFFYLSIDEVAMLHEYPIEPLRKAFNMGGFFYYSWIIPAIIILIVLGIIFWKFLCHLPVRTKVWFIIAGAVYVGGAIGIEMISGYHADIYGEQNMLYAMIITCEEVMEMIGVTLFINALREYLSTLIHAAQITIT
ncbi:MAG: hypothetical protein GY874_20785 [Desulfobacteraceae bacterium]|nr:hypothetical protein [Desulfobacteraceae bacterium]